MRSAANVGTVVNATTKTKARMASLIRNICDCDTYPNKREVGSERTAILRRFQAFFAMLTKARQRTLSSRPIRPE